MTILVTGGAGFIGSNFVLDWLEVVGEPVVNLDALTYAGNLRNLDSIESDSRHHFVQGEIGNRDLLNRLLAEHAPRAVVHFAAESHVDRSIHGPADFMRTNVMGTYTLLEAVHAYWDLLAAEGKAAFRFHHISTDEVYGSLAADAPAFTEIHPCAPSSPYAASKAASDHLVRAWHRTYGLPVLITNCSNNYGPFQFPEKLIPLVIANALAGTPVPVYGDGLQVRDWVHVRDHVRAIRSVLIAGRVGETYNVGGSSEKTTLEVVHAVCSLLDDLKRDPAGPYRRLITHVKDRPGHDRRCAVDHRKIQRELAWQPAETFESGMSKTVRWYCEHADWMASAQTGAYRAWIAANYHAR